MHRETAFEDKFRNVGNPSMSCHSDKSKGLTVWKFGDLMEDDREKTRHIFE